MSTPEQVQEQARMRGLISGAVYRGEVWPKGTLVRWKGKNSKVTYRVTDVRKFGTGDTERWVMEITPLQPGPGRTKCNASKEHLREVSE